jgi:FkbM family methyltransferase
MRHQTFAMAIKDVTVRFSTVDRHAHSWFYPRYAKGRIHERRVTEMLIHVLSGANCFVDVGTYLGWYTCLASKHMPQGKVFGFEMDEFNFALLKQNLVINKCNNVDAHNLAVYDSCSVLSYKREQDHPSPLFRVDIQEPAKNSSDLISIDSITLDRFFQNRDLMPDVVKIDVEGAEMNVLRGMRGLIEKYKPSLFLEIHPFILPLYNSSVTVILSLLIESGYKLFEIDDIRSQEACDKLIELSPESVLKRNSVIYAVEPK